MLLVLDTNIYVFSFMPPIKPSCRSIVKSFASSGCQLRIPRTIVEEVRSNLARNEFREFFEFISILTIVDEDFFVPFELGVKYERMGLKQADALIAAYADWVGADALVSENRHFLGRNPHLPFKVLNAENCLKLIQASLQ